MDLTILNETSFKCLFELAEYDCIVKLNEFKGHKASGGVVLFYRNILQIIKDDKILLTN